MVEETNYAVEGGTDQGQENDEIARRLLMAKHLERATAIDREEADDEQPPTYGQAASSFATPMVQRDDIKIIFPTEDKREKVDKRKGGVVPTSSR